MGFIVITPITALAAWAIFAIARWLRRGGYGPHWWRAYIILAVFGFAVGIGITFFLQYTVANFHLSGFPIPVHIANREKPGAPWNLANMPVFIRLGAIVTDLLCGIAACLFPIAVKLFITENRGKLGGEPGGNPP